MNHLQHLSYKVLLTVLPLFSFFFAVGQNAGDEGLLPVQRIDLNEVVISANKVKEPVRKLSQSVTSISSISIRKSAAATTADLLSGSLGMNVQKSQQGGGSPNIRGFEASRILLVVDGIRMNNLIYRSGHLQNIITIDPLVLEKVEVLYGPSSTLYGSDALGGTIHMITRDPLLADKQSPNLLKLNAYTRYSSASNGFAAHVDINAASSRLGSLSSLTYNTFGDLRMGKNKNPFYPENCWQRDYYIKRYGLTDSLLTNDNPLIQKFSGYRQVDLLQKFILSPGKDVQHKVNLQFSTSGNIPRYDRLTEPGSGGLKYAEWYYGPQTRLLAAYDLTMRNIVFFDQLHLGLSGQYLEESRHSRKTGQNFLTHRYEYVSVLGGTLDLMKDWGWHTLRTGLEMQMNKLVSAACNENVINGTNIPVTSRYPDGKNHMGFVDIYFSHRMDIGEKNSFNQGLRVGYSSLYSTFIDTELFPYPFREMTQKTPTWSASLGWVHLPDASHKIACNLSTGYRVPNIDDLAKIFERPSNAIVVPNPDVKPEKTYNAELSFTTAQGNGFRWETSVYGTLFDNIIVVGPSTYQGQDSIFFEGELCQVLSGQNKNTAFLYGFSSSITGMLTHAIKLDASVLYTYGRVKEGDDRKPLNNIHPLSLRAGADYHHKAFNTNVFILYNAWKLIKDYYFDSEDNEQYATPKGMPAWFTVNFRAGYQFNNIIHVQLGVDNLLDTRYRVFASGINAPGRNILLTLKVSL